MSSTPSGGPPPWDRLVDQAVEALDSGRLEEFQLPEELTRAVESGHLEDIRMVIFSAAFERWVRSQFPAPPGP